jgi:tRNA/rRNA methyltransferase
MHTKLEDIRVVLVEPQDNRNVGQVCRAMKTMGLRRLYLAGAARIDREEAGITALRARDLLEQAVSCATLEEALRGTSLAAGVSRRRGRWRKYFALDPEQLVERIAAARGPCALVFGRESDGLTDEELALCHVAVRIPSSPEFPSLNLSHAVQVLAYLLFRRLDGRQAGGGQDRYRPIQGEQVDRLVEAIVASLSSVGFFGKGSPQEMGIFWRDLLARAGLEQREAERLKRIFHEIRGLAAARGISP